MTSVRNILKMGSLCIFAGILVYTTTKNLFTLHNSQKLPISATIPTVDFDESMQAHNYQKIFEHEIMQKLYTTFREQYIKFNPTTIKPDSKTRIPKKLHQIWLGGNGVLPEEYRQFQESWKRFHPLWKYKLWTEKDIPTFSFKNKDLFDAAKNYGEKSDIWRYEILEQEGGLYIDTDFECLAPFDIFNHTYDFYIGIQPLDTDNVQLGIGLIGTRQGHPLLKLAIKNLRINKHNKQIVSRTGPLFFTQIFYQAAPKTELRDIAFPASYFYPCNYNQRNSASFNWLKPESFAVHHWAGSWLKKEAFEK